MNGSGKTGGKIHNPLGFKWHPDLKVLAVCFFFCCFVHLALGEASGACVELQPGEQTEKGMNFLRIQSCQCDE